MYSPWIRALVGARFPAPKIELMKTGWNLITKKERKKLLTVTFTPPAGWREGCLEPIRAVMWMSFPEGDIWWSYLVTSPPHLFVIDSCLHFPPLSQSLLPLFRQRKWINIIYWFLEQDTFPACTCTHARSCPPGAVQRSVFTESGSI